MPSINPASVCIVTHEFAGIPGSGGIGTAFAGLAERLAAAGHPVTVLCTGLLPLPEGFERAAPHPGVTLRRLPTGPLPLDADHFLRLSHEAFVWLSGHRFDVVHFADWTGLGFCATLAKRQGIAFADTTLAVGLHGPTRWVRSATGGAFEGPEELAIDFLERRSAEQADVAIGPSRYLVDWLRESGWNLPARTEVRQNLLPGPGRVFPGGDPRPVRELVFFGRLETRKGVTLFCDALDRLAHRKDAPADLRVTFLGGSAPVEGEDGAAYVRRRAAAWPWPVDGRHGLSSAEALAYLAGEGRLAVIPSRIENSPCTVAECLIRGLPFLASRVGGTAELVAEADAGRVLFEPDTDPLVARLAGTLRDGMLPARLRIPQDELAAEWLDWHRRTPDTAAPAMPARTGTHALLPAAGFRLVEDGAERLAAIAARTGAAVVGCMTERGSPPGRRLRAGGPAALALFRDVFGPGPLLVRRDLLDSAPPPEDGMGRRVWLTRLALAGHRVEIAPLVLAVEEADAPESLAPLPLPSVLGGGVPDAVADLARVAVGLEERSGRLTAERDRLAASRRALVEERNRLIATLEAETAVGEREREAWRARLAGLLDSRSWRLSAPLRRRLGGIEDSHLAILPPDRAADAVSSSVWWDLAAAWRLAARIKGRLCRRWKGTGRA